ncbi:MAG TPA: N-acetylmuramoyl-L-alanine amidase [Chitinophagaceae bacterium]|nr:N-acetylmuramoyl-L-alanine amidase [Chitinophagaceae bacterium]
MKRTTFFGIVLLCATILVSFLPAGKEQVSPVKTIIIDAGHGGSDAGAKGVYSYEKDICLAISLKLGEIMAKEFPNIRLLYTRTKDTYPTLHSRANFANQNKGDLFLCIHVNAAPPKRHSELVGYKTVTSYVGKGKKRRKVTKRVPQYRYWTTPNPAKGTETYIWGAHKNEDKEIAMRENAPMLAEENFKQNYGDIDPNSPEFIALALLKTKQYFKRSATLAGFVQDEFAKVGRIDRDVRQRSIGIWVLQATAMPSILVETGYITNRSEEDYLNSAAGQKEIAECITRAVKNYIAWLEKNQVENGETTGSNNEPSPLRLQDTEAFLRAVEEKEKARWAK